MPQFREEDRVTLDASSIVLARQDLLEFEGLEGRIADTPEKFLDTFVYSVCWGKSTTHGIYKDELKVCKW